MVSHLHSTHVGILGVGIRSEESERGKEDKEVGKRTTTAFWQQKNKVSA